MPSPEQVRRISRLAGLYNLKVPAHPVCREHQSPGYALASLYYDRPSLILIWGPRGGGKSLLAGLDNYLKGGTYGDFEASVLGASQAQSEQIYRAMDLFRKAQPSHDFIKEMFKTEAVFHDPERWGRPGARVEMLAASEKSVRGPHKPQLNLDEVDVMDDQIRDDAAGMVVEKGRHRASIIMTSTWHKVAGSMAEMVGRGASGEFPVLCWCMFDVLERCPDERSGPNLEKCPECPLVRWCHADRDQHPSGLPKAKRSCGHYSIDALIQKTRFTSARIFESDYLCKKPRAMGQWFTEFDEDIHVAESAEYHPGYRFHTSIDTGVHTAAVWFQARSSPDGTHIKINVFADYYSEGVGAEANARAIIDVCRERTGQHTSNGRLSMDPAGSARTAIGPTVLGEYQRAGCVGQGRTNERWPEWGPGRPKADGLQLIEALLRSADGTVSLHIHPRCKNLIGSFRDYVRAKTPDGQWLDKPADPQHPQENPIDALVGGVALEFPEGRTPPPKFRRVKTSLMS